jgi:hypothetical protein
MTKAICFDNTPGHLQIAKGNVNVVNRLTTLTSAEHHEDSCRLNAMG